jgi:beta-glucanase (GH16 family)
LAVGVLNVSKYGYKFQGIGNYKDDVQFIFENTLSEMSLSVRGYDIDVQTEISVWLNGQLIGHLEKSENRKFAVTTIDFPSKALGIGSNILSFEQRRSGWSWGITDLLLTQPDPIVTPEIPNKAPILAVGEDITITTGDTVRIAVQAQDDGPASELVYLWTLDGSTVSNAMAFDYVDAATGVYEFTVTVSDAEAAVSSDTIQVTVNDAPMNSLPSLDGFELVFNEDFNGTELDRSKWDSALLWGPYLSINNEQQMYVDSLGMHDGFSHSPFELTGETLKIKATAVSETLSPPPRPAEDSPLWNPRSYSEYSYNATTETQPGYDESKVDYLSGILTTYGSFKTTHGYFETRAKLPAGKGLWPAFWLLPTHYVEDIPEIDVMEFLGDKVDRIYHTYHYFDPSDNWRKTSTPSFQSTAVDWTTSFHTFGMAWSPTEIIWYVDGKEARRVSSADYLIAKQSMYLIINLAVGGSWPGAPDADTEFPAEFEIDYIRAYKRKLSTPVNLNRDFQMVFNDEFEGSQIDADKWTSHFLWGPYLPMNQEKQYYVDALASDAALPYSPFSLEDGKLTITARAADDPDGIQPPTELPEINDPVWLANPGFQRLPDRYTAPEYTSGILTSYESFKFAYGYAEIRAKVPKGDGLWPAFWMLNGYYVSQQPEIDIMEMRGEDTSLNLHSYHRYGPTGHQSDSYETRFGETSGDYSDDFHTYAAHWQPDSITWYIDGQPVHTYRGEDVGYQLMYVLLNLAVGGAFNTVDIDPAALPASYVIDYVRVYQELGKE